MTAKTFGRRTPAIVLPVRRDARTPMPLATPLATPVAAVPVSAKPEPAPSVLSGPVASPLAGDAPEISLDEELRLWKEERRRNSTFQIPWRQVYLIASISFGLGSLVLPDSVNSLFDWALYLLSGASLAAWFQGREKKPAVAVAPDAAPGAAPDQSAV